MCNVTVPDTSLGVDACLIPSLPKRTQIFHLSSWHVTPRRGLLEDLGSYHTMQGISMNGREVGVTSIDIGCVPVVSVKKEKNML